MPQIFKTIWRMLVKSSAILQTTIDSVDSGGLLKLIKMITVLLSRCSSHKVTVLYSVTKGSAVTKGACAVCDCAVSPGKEQ